MRLGKAVFNIVVFVILLLLVFSFVRITLAGGNSKYRLTFASFADIFVNVDFDMSRFFVDFGDFFDDLSSSFRHFASVGNLSWTGRTVLEKILSVFIVVGEILIGFYSLFIAFVTSSASLLYDFYLLISTVFHMIGSLFGVFFL